MILIAWQEMLTDEDILIICFQKSSMGYSLTIVRVFIRPRYECDWVKARCFSKD